MIKTNNIKLSEKSYFNILLVKFFKQNWWWFALMTVLSILVLYSGFRDALSYVTIFSPIISAICILLFLRNFAYAKENRVIFLGRYYEIDNDLMVGFVEDGTQSQIKLEHFIKTYKTNDYVLVYLSQMAMIYLPKSAFNSQVEYNQAVQMIEQKIAEGKRLKATI